MERSGGEVLGSLHHPMGASDFASFMLQAQSSGADVIGIANAGGDLHNAVRVAKKRRDGEGEARIAARTRLVVSLREDSGGRTMPMLVAYRPLR